MPTGGISVVQIENKEFRRLLGHFERFIESPINRAARELARMSLDTLKGYDVEKVCISNALRKVIAQVDVAHWADKIQGTYGIKPVLMPDVVDGGSLLRQSYQALNHFPPKLVRACGIRELIFRNDMGPNRTHYPNHGYFLPSAQTITLNADIFYHPDQPDDFFDHRRYFITRPEQTILHEFAHGYDWNNGRPSSKPDWLRLSGWSETPRKGLRQIRIREEGCPEHYGEWYYHPEAEFTRFYAKKNPWDDYADSLSFYVGGLKAAVPSKKRFYFDRMMSFQST